MDGNKGKQKPRWRSRLHEIIYEADTTEGKVFDICLLAAILLSVAAVLLESVDSISREYGMALRTVEWVFTILFTIEYLGRIIAIGRPLKYMTSFLGVIDFLSIVPTYLSLALGGAQTFIVIRTIRLLRIFRIFKLARYLTEANTLSRALKASRFKVTVFFTSVIAIVLIMGALMYVVEGGRHGFTSIPRSIYWAVVTLTTVGYGDIVPQTVAGQAIATLVMLTGYAIIAVPTGIVSAELIRDLKRVSTQACPNCGREGHDIDARHCKYCGSRL